MVTLSLFGKYRKYGRKVTRAYDRWPFIGLAGGAVAMGGGAEYAKWRFDIDVDLPLDAEIAIVAVLAALGAGVGWKLGRTIGEARYQYLWERSL